MDTPPPLPGSVPTKSFFHQAATASVWAPLISVVLSLLVNGASVHDPSTAATVKFVGSVLGGLILILGVVAGIVALFGLPRYGRRGILVKAMCGILIPVGLVALAVPAVMAARNIAHLTKDSPTALDRQLEMIVREVRKKKGTMIDDGVRLEDAELRPGRKLAYTYTVTTMTKEDFAPGVFETAVRPALLESFKSNRDLRSLRGKDVSFVYIYKDKNGNLIEEISIRPADW